MYKDFNNEETTEGTVQNLAVHQISYSLILGYNGTPSSSCLSGVFEKEVTKMYSSLSV
jgi:hypothetical protein